MSFKFTFSKSTQTSFRRIALEQIDIALSAAGDARAVNSAHTIRKQCKRLRALMRLVRGSFPDYEREQRVARDAGRELASVREITAHLEALARLKKHDPERFGREPFAASEAWLRSLQAKTRQTHAAGATSRAVALLEAQRTRVPNWRLTQRGFASVSDGLAKTYRQGRQALSDACDDPSAHNLHELRKYVKHHRYHLELLRKIWPAPMAVVAEEAERLAELLGEHHDVHVLICALSDPSRGEEAEDFEHLVMETRPFQTAVERKAFCIAHRLYAEKPSRLCARLGSYWQASVSNTKSR